MLIIVTAKQLVMRCPLLQFIFPGIGTICIIKLLPLFILWDVNSEIVKMALVMNKELAVDLNSS